MKELRLSDGGCACFGYCDCVDVIEQEFDEASEPNDLEKEIWCMPPHAADDSYSQIWKRSTSGVGPPGMMEPIVGLLHGSGAKLIVDAHNESLRRLTERTARQVLKDSGIPITMTKDGIVVGDSEPANILETIKNSDLTIKKTKSDEAILKVGKPDRVVLEYDIDKVTKRRIIVDDKSCVIEDYDWSVPHEG